MLKLKGWRNQLVQGDLILGIKDHARSNWNVFWELRTIGGQVDRTLGIKDTMCSNLTQTEMYFEIHCRFNHLYITTCRVA